MFLEQVQTYEFKTWTEFISRKLIPTNRGERDQNMLVKTETETLHMLVSNLDTETETFVDWSPGLRSRLKLILG